MYVRFAQACPNYLKHLASYFLVYLVLLVSDTCDKRESKRTKSLHGDFSTEGDVDIAFNLHEEAAEYEEYGYISSVVMGNIPSTYIKTQSHKQIEQIAFAEDHIERVVLMGPKGTGKSTCLVAIWALCKKWRKPVVFTSTNALRLYDTEMVNKYTRKIIEDFPKCKKKWKLGNPSMRDYVSFLQIFIHRLCKKSQQKVILLIDFTLEDNDITIQLANLGRTTTIKKNLQTILAVTSASGELITDDYVYSGVQKIMFEEAVHRTIFHGFTEYEAVNYLKCSGSQFSFSQVKAFAGFNPSLLSLASRYSKLEELSNAVNDNVVRFVNNNLPDNTSIRSVYIDRLKSSEYFLKKAVNGDPIDVWETAEYFGSWIYKHYACYAVKENPLVIRLNFPLLPNILHKEILQLPHNEREKINIFDNSIVKGIILEHTFFRYFLTNANFQVYTSLIGNMKVFKCILNTNYQASCVPIPKLYKSVLFQLRFGHPVIDGVGLLPDQQNKYFLLFIQVSLSKYSDHKSKVNDLFKYKSNSPELSKHPNLFEYYQSLAKIAHPKFNRKNCLYIYISPMNAQDESDEHVLKLLQKHADGMVKVGVMYKSSHLYQFLKNV